MTTLRDLARHLDLSVTQVSRALNGHSDVSEATRLRVEAAARQLNYFPNRAARRLVSGRSGVVGFVERSFAGIEREEILFATVTGLSEAFSERGMQFVLHLAPKAEGHERDDIIRTYDQLVRGGSLDGFVLTGPRPDDVRIRHLMENSIPFVVHGRTGEAAQHPFFDIDNFGLVLHLTRHLCALGHRRIGLISGPEHFAYVHSRQNGFETGLAEFGAAPSRARLRNGPMTEDFGMVSAVQMFSDPGDAPTAVICGNLRIAKGVYTALSALSLRIPEDVSVVAHDDVVAHARPELFFPALTVTRASLSESWGPLADVLRDAIEGKELKELQKISPYSFIDGASTAPARG
ncbi:substrate-binding domain-containing protein [Poseidonocella sp. HB161398]|uniref:substrate-binding domain-containing protein n=1 Tax=Poseidonocella sp. HB161398 TaxID=2320855 RepID=UPI001108F309|nr:substrate-binding domain-containing protein [Poseidonocella sp. HB161398]